MTYLGIDLAWNSRARSGLAAVDGAGALIDSTTAISDDDIDAWITSLESVRVVAIDAPLVVRNPSGSRECEKLIGAAYRRFHAGPYPANTGDSLFAPPRGRLLAERHAWPLDPDVRPCAIEVYPHAAMVGLFRLGRVLPYKAKRHRDLGVRLAALNSLCDRLEGIGSLGLHGHSRWGELRSDVAVATRPFQLKRAEDELDAIFCAHLAWLWATTPGALACYGDPEDGCIMAPPAPDWEPSRTHGR